MVYVKNNKFTEFFFKQIFVQAHVYIDPENTAK